MDHNKYLVKTPEQAESMLRSIFGIVPYVGGFLNEVFFDYRSRINQERINKLVTYVAEGMAGMSSIEKDKIVNEDFSDLFELILRKTTQTRSEEKLKIFKSILLNQINTPIDYDRAIEMTEVIAELTEEQFLIIKSFYSHDEELSFLEKAYDELPYIRNQIINYSRKKEPPLIDRVDDLKYLSDLSDKAV